MSHAKREEVTIGEFTDQVEAVLGRVRAGAVVTITSGGRPLAQIIPLQGTDSAKAGWVPGPDLVDPALRGSVQYGDEAALLEPEPDAWGEYA